MRKRPTHFHNLQHQVSSGPSPAWSRHGTSKRYTWTAKDVWAPDASCTSDSCELDGLRCDVGWVNSTWQQLQEASCWNKDRILVFSGCERCQGSCPVNDCAQINCNARIGYTPSGITVGSDLNFGDCCDTNHCTSRGSPRCFSCQINVVAYEV